VSISVLGYTMLGLLARGPHTGYDLVRLLRRPIGYYWTAQQSQIYPELGRLAQAGLVVFEAASGPGPREKKTYATTAEGRAALATWLPLPPGSHAPRDELMVKTFAVAAADADQMRALYLTMSREHAQRAEDFERQQAELDETGAHALDHPRFGNYATLRMGVAYERMRQEWCTWMAAQLTTPARRRQDPLDHELTVAKRRRS